MASNNHPAGGYFSDRAHYNEYDGRTDGLWRVNRILGAERNQPATLAPSNGVTGFGEILVGTPLSYLPDGAYVGMYRPAAKNNVETDSTGTTVELKGPEAASLFFVGDRVCHATDYGHGRHVGANVGPFLMANGQTIKVKVDGGGEDTVTVVATRASVKGADATYAAVVAGHVLALSVNGNAQEIAFAGTEDNQAKWMQAINDQIVGGRAVLVDVDEVKFESDIIGTGGAVAIDGVNCDADVLASLGLVGNEEDDGSTHGNVANVTAVTVDELILICNDAGTGLDGSTAYASAGKLGIRTNTAGVDGSLEVTAGTANTAIGFTAAVYAGGAETNRGLTVTSRDLTLNTITIDQPVVAYGDTATYDGDVIRLDETVAGFGAGKAVGVSENTRSTWNPDAEEFVPNQVIMGTHGVAYEGRRLNAGIVGICNALKADLQSEGRLIQFVGNEYPA